MGVRTPSCAGILNESECLVKDVEADICKRPAKVRRLWSKTATF